jgi:hypothetical protein
MWPWTHTGHALALRARKRFRTTGADFAVPPDVFPSFAFRQYGNPVNGGNNRGAGWSVYRFHTGSPVPFEKYFKMSIEHGHANHRSDNFYTVAYWYQKGPHSHRKPPPDAT